MISSVYIFFIGKSIFYLAWSYYTFFIKEHTLYEQLGLDLRPSGEVSEELAKFNHWIIGNESTHPEKLS